MSNRPGQAGTVVKKGRMWHGRYYADVPGQQKRKCLSVPLAPIKSMTITQAKRKLRSMLEQLGINSSDYLERVDMDVRTFSREAEWWRANRLSLFKPSTQEKMGSHLDKYLLPRFGRLPVSAIDERQVQQFIADLSRTEYESPSGAVRLLSPSTIPNIVTVLKLILGKKFWREWNIRLPEIPFIEQRYFSGEEMAQIVSAAKGQSARETVQWRTLFALMAGSGLRCGEVFALRVDDLDLRLGKINVRRSIHKGREGSVKTKKGHRVVHVEPALVDMLKQHLSERTSGLVFQTRTGTPFSKDNVRRKLHSILGELGLKRGGLHAFRHGRVSFLRKQGVPDVILKDWIGHSTLRMTDGYTHFDDAHRQRVAADLGVLAGVAAADPPKSSQVVAKIGAVAA
jgi:integrase